MTLMHPCTADLATVRELMTPHPIVVHDDLDIDELVGIFLDRGISQAPVIDATGKAIGLVTTTDLLADRHLRGDTELVDQRGTDEPNLHVHGEVPTVRDVMTPLAYALPVDTRLLPAARLMVADNIHALPVVDSDGRVVGILSATDVLGWVARQ